MALISPFKPNGNSHTYHLDKFLSLIGGSTGSSESKHVKMPHCWKSHVAAHICMCAIASN